MNRIPHQRPLHRVIAFAVLLAASVGFATAARAAIGVEEVQDSLQASAFRYFWYQANPANGLIRDRSQVGSPCSVAAVGFGLTAICIGVDHGYVSRADARARVLTTLQTFWNGPQGPDINGMIGYHGFFYHFLDMSTATRFTTWSNVELSTIDTGLLLAGIMDAKQFFDTSDPDEVQIRTLADQIYQRVDWPFLQAGTSKRILHGWLPESGYLPYEWTGYCEAMILYLLALGSDSHPLASPLSAWTSWAGGYSWQTWYGYSYVNFPPLFGHQYSHCWVDFRGMQDASMRNRGIDYFINSQRATRAQQAYCVANPSGRVGYAANQWGLTAGDGPGGYNARGAPPAQNDDGTIAPTAAIGSIPFAPDICIPVAQNLYDNYPLLWGPYGFKDGFNLTSNPDWYDTDWLGIDEGPIIIMIENYRTQKVWKRFMNLPEIQLALVRAGFTGVTGVEGGAIARKAELRPAAPNPFSTETTLYYELPREAPVRLRVFDVTGREVALLVDTVQSAGFHHATFAARGLQSGVYRARLECAGTIAERTIVHLR